MLKEMLQIAKDMNLRSIIASITSENEGSIVLFSKYGFKHAGVFHDVGYKFGRFLDVTFLEYITEASLEEGTIIPSFKHFPWDTYAYKQ
jgi:phosphinothricin acetyltransferase